MSQRRVSTDKPFLHYGRHNISAADIDAVVDVLRGNWLTQGPDIEKFESRIAQAVSARHVIACSNGTAALHLSLLALGIGPDDIVVTTPITFLADANAARYVGAGVQLVDIDSATGNMSPLKVAELLQGDRDHRIKAIIPVHFAGQPCDLVEIYRLAKNHGASVIEDACHALGAKYPADGQWCHVGCNAHSDLAAFSFHPVKHVACGEGGAVTTASPVLAQKVRKLRSHGIERIDFQHLNLSQDRTGTLNPWYYELHELGYNYRLTDIQAALGASQLDQLQFSIAERQRIAQTYEQLINDTFADRSVTLLGNVSGSNHAYHLAVALIDFESFGVTRAEVMRKLAADEIGTQVHYIPIHYQPYYQRLFKGQTVQLPEAETYYQQALSIPMYPQLTELDCQRVVNALEAALKSKGESVVPIARRRSLV